MRVGNGGHMATAIEQLSSATSGFIGRQAHAVPVALRSADRELIGQVRALTELLDVPLLLCPPGAPSPAARLLLDSPAERAADGPVWPDALAVATSVTQRARDTTPSLVLPRDGEDVLRQIRRASSARRARVIGVMGARGGVGATSLAAVLARVGAARYSRTALVDLSAGAGVDLVLGIEQEPGVRWADLDAGGYDPQELVSALPTWRGVRVLSADWRAGANQPTAEAVLDAVVKDVELVVLDIPRQHQWELWAQVCDTVVLLAGCDLMSCAGLRAAGRVLGSQPIRLVVRGPAPGGLTAREVAHSAGLPLTVQMRAERSLSAALERGVSPGDRSAGPLMRASRTLADELGLNGVQG